MRTIAILLLSFLYLSLAIGADVRWTYSDFTTTAQTVKKVYITPIAGYGTNGNTIITGDRRAFTNDSAGSLIVSNVIVGRSYRVEFKGAYTDTVITNSFDSTVTGFVEAVNYIGAPLSDGGLTSYSKTAADARFHNVSGDTSTNAAFRGTFKIPAGATVGYVLTVTNADGSSAWFPGSGGVSTANTSNAYNLTFVIDRRYTNDTPHYAQISSSMTFTQASSDFASLLFAVDTNIDGTSDFRRTNYFHVNTGTTWAKSTITEIVPPGAAYGFTNISTGASTVALDVGSGAVMYFFTNYASGGSSSTSGALTNNDTRNVTFLGTVASSGFQGDGNGLTELDADNLIYGSIPIGRISDGLITSNKLDATAYVAFMGGGTGSSIAAGTNIVTVTNGSLVTVHGTANVTQAGLAAGSYAIKSSVWLNKPTGVATNYSSLSAAKTASASGDVITATAINVGATNLLKNGVDYSFQGVTLTHSNQIPESAGLALGVLDDRGQGALTNTVKGIKLIDFRSQVATSAEAISQTNPFVNSSAFGAIYITNPAANIRIDVDKITHSIVGNVNGSAAIFVHDCTNTEFNVGEIIDPLWLSPDVLIGLDEFDGDVFYQSGGAGVYWHHGKMTVKAGTIKGYGYGFYANATGFAGTDPARHVIENFWMTADEIVSSGQAAIYTVGNTNKYRMWINAKEVRSIAGQAITLFGSQRFYLNAQKISTDGNGAAAISLGSNGSPEAWIVSEKVSCTNGNFVLMATGQTGTLDITSQHYEDIGTAGGAIGFKTIVGTNLIHGGRAKIANGKGIWHEGGRTFAENLYVDTATTTNTANNPVFVKAAGLILKDCVLFAPAGAQCLAATNAQTVTILGTVICNQTNSSNITFVGGGTLVTNLSMIRL